MTFQLASVGPIDQHRMQHLPVAIALAGAQRRHVEDIDLRLCFFIVCRYAI